MTPQTQSTPSSGNPRSKVSAAALADQHGLEIEALIGAGGTAEVYRVHRRATGERFALKILTDASPSVLQRFRHEFALMRKLRHVHVVEVYDLIEVNGAPGLLMELVDGPNLAQLLASESLTLHDADLIGRELIAAMKAAHQAGLVHRDVKPANILLEPRSFGYSVKVVDFGIAKVLDPNRPATRTLTRAGSALGTVAYMAPEQTRDAGQVDVRADVFSVGAVLYEMVCGRPPFAGDLVSVVVAMESGRYVRPHHVVPDLPQRMQTAIAGALVAARDHRVPDMATLAALWNDEPPPRPYLLPPDALFGDEPDADADAMPPMLYEEMDTLDAISLPPEVMVPVEPAPVRQLQPEPPPLAPLSPSPTPLSPATPTPPPLPDPTPPPRRVAWLALLPVLGGIAAVIAALIAGTARHDTPAVPVAPPAVATVGRASVEPAHTPPPAPTPAVAAAAPRPTAVPTGSRPAAAPVAPAAPVAVVEAPAPAPIEPVAAPPEPVVAAVAPAPVAPVPAAPPPVATLDDLSASAQGDAVVISGRLSKAGVNAFHYPVLGASAEYPNQYVVQFKGVASAVGVRRIPVGSPLVSDVIIQESAGKLTITVDSKQAGPIDVSFQPSGDRFTLTVRQP